MPLAVGGGLGAVVLTIVALVLGIDPRAVVQQGDAPAGAEPGTPADTMGQFVAVVLKETEDTWNEVLAAHGTDYPEPTLVLFTDAVQSACGFAQSAVGPFYCPLDRNIYIDLGFYDDLRQRFGASGDFAQAYVIAHEVGHHVQNVLGISGQVQQAQQRAGSDERNRLSVRLELQADCLAGIWARSAAGRQLLDPDDIEEALNAAAAIGDDRLQRKAQGHVVPESFTHGSSEQRARWFRTGFDSGGLERCDTFGTAAV